MQLNQFSVHENLQKALKTVIDLPFQQFVIDSRKITENDVFVLLKSQTPNEQIDYEKVKSYLKQVEEKTAFVLSEIDLSLIENFVKNYTKNIVVIKDIRLFLGDLLHQSLQISRPSTLPAVIAVTGTNGKTTISQLTAQFLSFADYKVATMGTAGNGILSKGEMLNLTPSTHTTLEVFAMHHSLYDFARQDVDMVCIEASSHGLHQNRLQGVPIRVAIFSNLSRDHLDYHADMDEYASAKAKLFDNNIFPSLTHAIINLDDEYSQIFMDRATASNLTVWTYSLENAKADIFASNIVPSLDGVDMTIMTPQGQMVVKSPLLGRFNVANLLASIGAVLAMGVGIDKIANNIKHLQGARGRMQTISDGDRLFVVDYAHTPDAVEQVLKSLRTHCTGTLWAVFGCGGDRDKGKRPLMSKSALKFADKVVLTSDNPRSEDPNAILKDMQQGLDCNSHYKIDIELDRKKAIGLAIHHAKPGDIVAILGKGHETYQEIGGVRYDFDDVAVVGQMIQKYQERRENNG